MGTGRTDNKAPITRPKKSTSERTRRVNTHKKRLSALGISDEALVHMNPKEMRELLRKPALLKTA